MVTVSPNQKATQRYVIVKAPRNPHLKETVTVPEGCEGASEGASSRRVRLIDKTTVAAVDRGDHAPTHPNMIVNVIAVVRGEDLGIIDLDVN